jgi:hypothetical protein
MNKARNSDLMNEIVKWRENLMGAYAGGRRLHFVEKRPEGRGSVWLAFSAIPTSQFGTDDSACRPLGVLPCVKAITVGIDVREYSRRLPEQQLFITMCLYSAIKRSVDLLRKAGLMEPDEPRVTMQTGDGALVVFTAASAFNPIATKPEIPVPAGNPKVGDILTMEMPVEARNYAKKRHDLEARSLPSIADQALSFVFAVNTLLENENKRQGFLSYSASGQAPSAVFPVSVRYAMSYDDVLLMLDVNDALNCVGRGMITCSRILATDHGNHFLVDENLLRALSPVAGINDLVGGIWDQRLHSAMLQDTQVKTNTVRFADVFGFHSDGPVLKALGRHAAPRQMVHIGSHDIGAIDRGR